MALRAPFSVLHSKMYVLFHPLSGCFTGHGRKVSVAVTLYLLPYFVFKYGPPILMCAFTALLSPSLQMLPKFLMRSCRLMSALQLLVGASHRELVEVALGLRGQLENAL